ncbi:putative fasciclin-like arabinogalactan protein 20 [Punica granatum]|uniref:FAS1 domain-containing protein n=2 Tax=Punica granatum TaxID=22663 RepID=A0A218XP25_PUNGR|nr:putative fasciclin-like arabinogalactan protein 20 [Punica granatum]OWM86251.1 hypothetical protein CDL15_Pgr011075 [Punica granatum]PKI44291.1 hypothetical protein CRG98_035365 [Punica granatum]
MTAPPLLISLALLLSLVGRSLSLPSASITEATEVLLNSGFVSMALTLSLVSKSLTTPQVPSVTVFSPSDETFARSGQPPLSLLRFHFCPHSLPLETLRALPLGSKIPTMDANHSLVVTTSPPASSTEINGVKVVGSAVYDDGHLAVFEIEKFFDPQFRNQGPSPSPSPSPSLNHLRCAALNEIYPTGIGSHGGYCFREPNVLLRSTGYSVIASFLGMQLMESKDQEIMPLTIFAPPDESLTSHIGNFTEYPSVFLRHVVPCKLSISDLISYSRGTTLRTKLEGFVIELDRIGDSMTLNGVLVTFPDMYSSEWLSIHGVGGILVPADGNAPGTESRPKE